MNSAGTASSVTINNSADPRMSEAVKTAIPTWVFRPFSELGKPHEAKATVFVHFRLIPDGPHVLIPGLTK